MRTVAVFPVVACDLESHPFDRPPIRVVRGKLFEFIRTAPMLLALLAGCRQDMQDQPKYLPLQPSKFFADGRASRPSLPGTIPRGHLYEEVAYNTGRENGEFVTTVPVPLNAVLLSRGRERYDIYCSPCHDRVGSGDGMIVQRGYRRPVSFHIDRLRAAPAGYFFDVMTNGFGVMPKYRAQVPVADRWAIVSYIRALQLSQHAALGDVPAAERDRLLAPPAVAPVVEGHHE